MTSAKHAPRVVLDTNILISYMWGREGSTLVQAVDLTLDHCQLLASQATNNEWITKIRDFVATKKVSAEKASRFIEILSGLFEFVPILVNVKASRDPNDDKFLSLALNGEADYIVTGDQDLLVLKKFEGTEILTPAEFIALFIKIKR